MNAKQLWIVVLVFFIVSCSSSETSTLERIKKEGVIRVGFANDVPYAYVDSDGRLTGEAPEIARRVLADMGVNEMEGVYTEFGSLIHDLKAGRFDMIAAGMFITPERCREIAFSEPTYEIGQAFLVRVGNPRDLHSYEDVAQNPDVILAVMEGAVEGDYARAVGVPKARILAVPDPPTGLVAVKTGGRPGADQPGYQQTGGHRRGGPGRASSTVHKSYHWRRACPGLWCFWLSPGGWRPLARVQPVSYGLYRHSGAPGAGEAVWLYPVTRRRHGSDTLRLDG